MSDLPVEQTWMVLVELLTDLRKRGVEIDPSIPEDIRMAKTTINFYKVNPADPERMKEVKRINDFLNTAQNKLMDLAETQGDEYRAQWIKKLTQEHLVVKRSMISQIKSLNLLLVHHLDLQWSESPSKHLCPRREFRK